MTVRELLEAHGIPPAAVLDATIGDESPVLVPGRVHDAQAEVRQGVVTLTVSARIVRAGERSMAR